MLIRLPFAWSFSRCLLEQLQKLRWNRSGAGGSRYRPGPVLTWIRQAARPVNAGGLPVSRGGREIALATTHTVAGGRIILSSESHICEESAMLKIGTFSKLSRLGVRSAAPLRRAGAASSPSTPTRSPATATTARSNSPRRGASPPCGTWAPACPPSGRCWRTRTGGAGPPPGGAAGAGGPPGLRQRLRLWALHS